MNDTILKNNKEGNLSLKEKLMSHSTRTIPLDSVYHSPDVMTLYEEFKLHIPNLTINDSERHKVELAKKQEKITEFESKIHENEKLKKDVEILKLQVQTLDKIATSYLKKAINDSSNL